MQKTDRYLTAGGKRPPFSLGREGFYAGGCPARATRLGRGKRSDHRRNRPGIYDSEKDAAYIAEKVATLRVFEDSAGKMNLALADVGGAILAVSQFTLLGDARGGRRPSFIAAARPEEANPLYEAVVADWRARDLVVETGIFGADMAVSLVNDGPVTLLLDSQKLF